MRYAIYCGSSKGIDRVFTKGTIGLAEHICQRQHCIVYGGASVGLMGVMADTVLDAGHSVIGVMPTALVDKELQHPQLTKLYQVENMQQRKAKMAELADAYIAMPGGVGTLEEIFEVWTAGQLGFHHKACAFYNIDGYFDELIKFIQSMVAKGFMQQIFLDKLIVESDPEQLLDAISNYQAPKDKWS